MQSTPGPLLRRLIVPQIVLLLAAVAVVTLAKLAGADQRTVIVTAVVAWAIASALIAFVSLRYAKTQAAETAELFRRALPSPLPESVQTGDALEPLAETFARL